MSIGIARPISYVALFTLSLAACKDPHANVPRAQSTAPSVPAVATAAPAHGDLERLSFGPPQSSIGFTGAKVTGSHDGTFGGFQGTIQLDPTNLPASRVEVTIETSTIQVDAQRLTEHLKSPDFFDVARYPRATFVSTEVRAGGADGATHTVTGNLTLHGVTRAISFPATLAVSPTEVSARANFTINRREFGLTYPGMPDNLIRDDVAIRLNIHAPRGATAPTEPAAPAPSTEPAPSTPTP